MYLAPYPSLLIATYFVLTLLILAIAGIVLVQGQATGVLVGASLIALLRTGQFYYAAEGSPLLSLGNKRRTVFIGVVAAVVDIIVVAVGLALVELIRSTALEHGLSRRSTDQAAIIASSCIISLIVVSPKLIRRKRA